MSESPDSEDSTPSLSSYPPAFVSLIQTFIKRAEEAETRAHKALVILKTKDEQMVQLQKRMELLEKIACRLEEVMVPPLDLPKSPMSFDELSGHHPRDVNKQFNHQPVETSNDKPQKLLQEKESSNFKDSHNCYVKCQHLIDGLERSNCQLREALAAESQQRVKDHEQYVATLAKVTEAFKELQKKQNSNSNKQVEEVQYCEKENLNIPNETETTSKAGGDVIDSTGDKNNRFNQKDHTKSCKNLTALDRGDLKEKISLAKNIISLLGCKLEKRHSRGNKQNKNINLRKSEKSDCNISPKQSLSSHHTSKSSSALKLKRVHISSHCFISALKKQNKVLKRKYYSVCDKFTQSLTLCETLQKQLCLKKSKSVGGKVNYSTQSTQTEELFSHTLISSNQDKAQSTRSAYNILQGRLDAAAKVMAKQCRQIQDLQKQLGESLGHADSLRKRLARTEATAAAKDMLGETTKKHLEDSEKRNLELVQELQLRKDSCSRLKQELAIKTEECSKVRREKEICETEFKDMKISLETKLLSLGAALEQRRQMDQASNELQNKLITIREQFIAQLTDAKDRLVAADFKIQELYLGIETFLKLLFSLNSPETSPSSQAQAVQVASEILQMPPVELQTILYSSRCDLRAARWIKECNRMVHEKVFAKNLGNLLLDAVLEAKIV